MATIPPDALLDGGMNAPAHEVSDLAAFVPDSSPGASRYRHTLPGGEHLDALLVNKESDTLVVTFHGALDRAAFELPRFERLKSTSGFPVSGLYLADPALWRDEKLQLAWFTGWEGFDLPQVLADWSVSAARAVGASRIVFTGSSGGGFAALMVSALVPGSLAVPFNPQTSVFNYLADNHMWGPQEDFRAAIWPQLTPEGGARHTDWTTPAGTRLSPLQRYAEPVDNHVFYVTNSNEFHHEKHFLPFVGAAATGGNLDRVKWREYKGSTRHNPPPPPIFHEFMGEALEYAAALHPAARVNA